MEVIQLLWEIDEEPANPNLLRLTWFRKANSSDLAVGLLKPN